MSVSGLLPLIEAVQAAQNTHVVAMVSDAGIHWLCETESACLCIAKILGNCKVMTKEDFINGLETIDKEIG